jgi:SynChlorMet cassette radical SAM/SPASM protein ScmF
MEEVQKGTYPLRQVYFYLTDDCNLACRHCWIAPTHTAQGPSRSFLKVELFRSILDQAKIMGLSSVKLSGGEPFLHPHIQDILEMLRLKEIPVTIETNGVLCSREMSEKIAACRGPFVAVSLDGAEAAIHEWVRGVVGSFEAALQGIRNLVASGIRPQVIMTVMKRNRDQMAAVVELAHSLGAGSVKFNLVQPTARGEQMSRTGETLDIEELLELGSWVENTLSKDAPIRVIVHHPAAFRPLGRMLGDYGDGCGVCGILGIIGVLADGSYALCGIGKTVPELVFGHSEQDLLADIWCNAPVLREIREGLPRRLDGVCGSCLMKGRCLGACIAQNYYSTGELWAPFWYCKTAHESGLFPETRLTPVGKPDSVGAASCRDQGCKPFPQSL